MEHLIRFKTAEGIDGTHVAATLDDAVAFVERLRNAEGAHDVRLHRLTEVPIEFRTYYRVEVGTAEPHEPAPQATPAGTGPHAPQAPPAAAAHPGPPTPDGAVAHPPAGDLPESAAANGRRLFSRTS